MNLAWKHWSQRQDNLIQRQILIDIWPDYPNDIIVSYHFLSFLIIVHWERRKLDWKYIIQIATNSLNKSCHWCWPASLFWWAAASWGLGRLWDVAPAGEQVDSEVGGLRGQVAATVTFVNFPRAGNWFVTSEDVMIQPVFPVSHIATARLMTLVTRTWVMSSVGHLLNVQHHEASLWLNHPVMILLMSRMSEQWGECFVTLFTLEVSGLHQSVSPCASWGSPRRRSSSCKDRTWTAGHGSPDDSGRHWSTLSEQSSALLNHL